MRVLGVLFALSIIAFAGVTNAAPAQQCLPPFYQCGGSLYTGPTSCCSGQKCVVKSAYYSQCVPNDNPNCAPYYGQCGGQNYTGPACCSVGDCKFVNAFYSQCILETLSLTTTVLPTTTLRTTMKSSTTKTVTSPIKKSTTTTTTKTTIKTTLTTQIKPSTTIATTAKPTTTLSMTKTTSLVPTTSSSKTTSTSTTTTTITTRFTSILTSSETTTSTLDVTTQKPVTTDVKTTENPFTTDAQITTSISTTITTTTNVEITSTPLADKYIYRSSSLESGWENWSWSSTIDFAYAGSNPALPSGSTSAIQVKTDSWAGISFKSTPFTGYNTIAFSVAGDFNFGIHASDTSNDASDFDFGALSNACVSTPTASSFVQCFVDLKKAPAGSIFNRFTLASNSADAQTIYLTNIYLSQKSASELVSQTTTTTQTIVTPAVSPIPDQFVYKSNKLESGWENWSWSSTFDFAFAGSTPALPSGSASAIQVQTDSWAGISFKSNPFAGYNTIAFSVAGDFNFELHASDTSNDVSDVDFGPLSKACVSTPTVTGFTQCFFDLTKAPAGSVFNRFSLTSSTASLQTIYLTNIFVTQKSIAELIASAQTTTTIATPTVSPIPDKYVYNANKLESGWENWSWSSTFDFAFAGSTPALPAGSSAAIQVQTTSWAGISFKSTPFTGYNTIAFMVAGDYNFGVHASDTSNDASDVDFGPLSKLCLKTPTATEFTVCYVDLTKAPAGSVFNRFSFASGTSDSQTIYFTKIFLSQKSIAELSTSSPTTSLITSSIPTATTAPSPMADRAVYQANNLESGWENWSWSSTFDFAFAGSTPTLPSGSTTAIQVQTTSWAGISFKSTFFTGYNTLVFYVAGDYNFGVHVSDTTNDASDVDLGALSSICLEPPSASKYTVCYADLTKAPAGATFNRFSLNSGTSDSQTIYLTNIYFTQRTAAELKDTKSFTVGAAFGSNTFMLLGTGDAFKVTVSKNGNNIGIATSEAVSSPIPRVYFTISSSWQPGNYSISHANGTISFSIPEAVTADISGTRKTKKINPLVYGVNFPTSSDFLVKSGIPLGRWGGNAMTTYNPENFWINSAADWYYENRASEGVPNFLSMLSAGSAKAVVSLPSLDGVSKNISCSSYSVKKYGDQQKVDPFNADAGNGVLLNGTKIKNDPSDCYTTWTPDLLYNWLLTWPQAWKDQISIVTIDNEMDIADGTHADLQHEPMTYDLELNRLAAFGAAIRRAIPDIKIAGPTSCCHWFWFHSAAGPSDMAAHGGLSKIRYLLRSLYKRQANLLDYLDLHFNPVDGATGDGSPADNALRLRSTRSWWDPTFTSEGSVGQVSSWPDGEPNPGKVMFIPRFKQMIAEEYPGLGLGASEWYGSADLVGGLQVADTLGIFGREELDFATRWDGVAQDSAGYAAFWLFRGGANSGTEFPSNYIDIPIFYDPNLSGVYFATTGSKDAGVFVNKDPTNYQTYNVKGLKPGKYLMRHFGSTATNVAENGARLTTTIQLDESSTVVVAPYTAVFLIEQ
ncbi:hypothetical protein HK098_007955 [Nowakowskiella sp. JEL0407]|nr:hypothetical protein HK098_007955 [Nowakowskiella sp. JEL0407]